MNRDDLTRYLDNLLEAGRFRDYCPNGLQVEGRAEIGLLIAGVSASQALLDAAIAAGADAILVHHGWFWRGEDGRVTGIRKARLQTVLAHDINLIAYHLPLDNHPTLGNNARLGELLDWVAESRFGDQDLGWVGRTQAPQSLASVAALAHRVLRRKPLVIGDIRSTIRRVAWCSGAAQNLFEQAITLGVDLYLSGEISEQTVHLARETGVAYIAAGHHATERAGVCALAAHVQACFGVDCRFIDLDNPV